MRKNQKGFTLVELLVVIAILAILATVAVVGYSSFIESAKESNDKTLVGQMNTALQGFDALQEQPETISDLVKAFNDMGIKLDEFKTNKDKMYFYWVKDSNRIIYVDENNNVVYPKDVDTDGQWYSLSGEIPFEDYTVTDGKTFSVANGNQFAKLVNDYNNGDFSSEEITITLTGDIDLKGATCKFGDGQIKGTIVLDGKNKTIYGFRDDIQTFFGSGNFAKKGYGYGLFGSVADGATVTVKDLTIKNAIIENTVENEKLEDFGCSAVLFGAVYGTVNIENVEIEDCTVYGADKVGSLIGFVSGGSANLNGVTVKNTKVYGTAYVAKAIGAVQKTSHVNIDNVNCDSVITGINTDWFELSWSKLDNWLTDSKMTLADAKTYLENDTNIYVPWLRTDINKDWKQLHGIVTSDLYWLDVATHDGNAIKEENKVLVNNIDAGVRKTGNESYNVSKS